MLSFINHKQYNKPTALRDKVDQIRILLYDSNDDTIFNIPNTITRSVKDSVVNKEIMEGVSTGPTFPHVPFLS